MKIKNWICVGGEAAKACGLPTITTNWKIEIENWNCVGGEAAKTYDLSTITKNLKLKIENWICVGEEAAKTCGLPTITTNWKIENWKFKLCGRGGCQGLWLANHHNQEHNHLSKERVPVSSGDFCRDSRDQRSCKFFCHLCKYFAYGQGRVDWPPHLTINLTVKYPFPYSPNLQWGKFNKLQLIWSCISSANWFNGILQINP